MNSLGQNINEVGWWYQKNCTSQDKHNRCDEGSVNTNSKQQEDDKVITDTCTVNNHMPMIMMLIGSRFHYI